MGIVSIQFAYSRASQISSDKSNNSNSLNVQNIPAKKVHVGDIDISYKVLGNGDPIRGVGSTNIGTRPFSMIQFANSTAGLLDALIIQKADVLGYSIGSIIAQELTLLHPEKVKRHILHHEAEKKIYHEAKML